MTDATPLAEAHAAEAINAEVVAAEAREKAHAAQMEVLLQESEKRMTGALATVLRDVFGENQSSGRFVDVSRIPLICQNIMTMSTSITNIDKKLDSLDEKYVSKTEFSPVSRLVFGGAVVLMLAALSVIITHAIPGAQVSLP